MQQTIHKIAEELKSNISEKYKLRELKIFGSSVRGDRRADSDIDVFILLTKVDRKIEENLFDMAYDLELKYDCLIDLLVFDEELLKGRFVSAPIFKEILNEGLIV